MLETPATDGARAFAERMRAATDADGAKGFAEVTKPAKNERWNASLFCYLCCLDSILSSTCWNCFL